MTRLITIIILSLVTVLSAKSTAAANRHALSEQTVIPDFSSQDAGLHSSIPVTPTPVFPAPVPEAPHDKTKPPQMEEIPHIHRFHKERVKKIKQHHTKFWVISQAILVICQLSMLVIAYLHLTH